MALVESYDYARFVNNTYVDSSSPSWYCISFVSGATYGKVINNVFYNVCRDGGSLHYATPDSQEGFLADYNLAYLAGDPSEPHLILDEDPLFVNRFDDNYHLQSLSPAVDSAGPLAHTTNAGSDNQITVDDAGYFVDGWGIVEGDQIIVGSNPAAKIAAINYDINTITLDRSISWNIGDGVYYSHQGSGPDRGAYENGLSSDFSITIPDPQQTGNGSLRLEALVDNDDAVRFVSFLVDGIEYARRDASPYLFDWNTSELSDSQYTLEVRAYAHSASSTLWKSADSLRANSDLRSSEYSTPVMGLIFLKFADNKYRRYEAEIIAEYEALKDTRRAKTLADIAVEKCGFYLPDKARYSTLLNLPEDQDIDRAIKDAMVERIWQITAIGRSNYISEIRYDNLWCCSITQC